MLGRAVLVGSASLLFALTSSCSSSETSQGEDTQGGAPVPSSPGSSGDPPPGSPDTPAPGAPDAPAPEASGCSLTPSKADFDVKLQVGGRERVARVHVPTGYAAGKPTPVVLNFHGRMSNASQEELVSGTTTKSNAAGFVVVYPTGIGQTWNAGLCCGQAQTEKVDDVAFTRALLDELDKKLCVDKKRVFATGLSNGAFMANRLACELADRIAAIAPVAGQLISSPCSPVRPVPVMHFHGTEDNVVDYDGMIGVPSAEASVSGWAQRNGCKGAPQQTYNKGDATCKTYGNCKGGADATLCTITGGGHTWPGGFPTGFGKTSKDIDATSAMWTFFESHPMP